MPEKIGKYEILGRIGRGGMGTIFKGLDPVLNRPVALKVISTEIEVTDELRARFFREAQACARLSHRNIVTVYDIGEDKGRLFIVMELVEGVELRRLIAERAALTLEDKLSVMRQVCDGLHYAHHKGIVHRDIKPGNILLQRNGQVKILDFGIARVANAEGDLTRTGLIMGTLQYIAPEQVRGRADHRSDIFSVGAVFYELLSWRPPFTGENPIQLLEQLRTEEPPSLSQLEPSIPPRLAGIVDRAMRKDPAERFDDLGQMKVEIEQVQRGLAEEAQRVRSRVQGQRDQLRELQAALTERIGGAGDGEPIPTPAEQDSLAGLQALEGDLAGQIEEVRAKIGRAEALAAAVRRGMELLEAGQFADATVEFEAIVASMPDHVWALEGLRRARIAAETQRRGHLAARLVQDARAALAEDDYALCLEILKQAAELPPPPEAAREIDSLRRSAEGALATEQAVREARECAERARYQMTQARQTAQAQATPQQAPALWAEAEAKVAEGQAALKGQAYAEAAAAFDGALALYRQAEAEAREVRRRHRELAEEGRRAMTERRQQALAVDAGSRAPEDWAEAEASARAGEAGLEREAFAEASLAFDRSAALYQRAEARARDIDRGVETTRADTDEGIDVTVVTRRLAAEVQAPKYASELWRAGQSAEAQAGAAAEAEARRTEAMMNDARRLLAAGDLAACLRRLHAVLGQRPGHAGAEGLRLEVEGRLRQPEAAPRQECASAADVPSVTSVSEPPDMPRGLGTQGPGPTGDSNATRLSSELPALGDARSTGLWPRASKPPVKEPGRPRVILAGGIAVAVGALVLIAVAIFYGLPRIMPLGSPPTTRTTPAPRPPIAPPAPPPAEAPDLGKPDVTPPELPPRKATDRTTSLTAPGSGPIASRPRDPEDRGQAKVAAARARQDAEQARARMASARRAAEQAAAGFYAQKLFAVAQAKEQAGATALVELDYGEAIRLLGEAQSDYQAAAQEARREAESERQLAPLRASLEQARASTASGRERALTAGADRLAKDHFEEAQAKHVEADGLATRQNLTAAAQAYREAAERYVDAAVRAQAVRQTK